MIVYFCVQGSRLFTAAEEGDVSLVRQLIQLGANVNYRDNVSYFKQY